ncbi:hypothetical protein E4U58_004956, partial [Claviceps cyperi]
MSRKAIVLITIGNLRRFCQSFVGLKEGIVSLVSGGTMDILIVPHDAVLNEFDGYDG